MTISMCPTIDLIRFQFTWVYIRHQVVATWGLIQRPLASIKPLMESSYRMFGSFFAPITTAIASGNLVSHIPPPVDLQKGFNQ
jgi:hypothetical protein